MQSSCDLEDIIMNLPSTSSCFILLSSNVNTELEKLDRPRVFIRKTGDSISPSYNVQFSDLIKNKFTVMHFDPYKTPAAAVAAAYHILHNQVRSAVMYDRRGGSPRWLF